MEQAETLGGRRLTFGEFIEAKKMSTDGVGSPISPGGKKVEVRTLLDGVIGGRLALWEPPHVVIEKSNRRRQFIESRQGGLGVAE